MRILQIQNYNTNFQGIGSVHRRMRSMSEMKNATQILAENVEKKAKTVQEKKGVDKEWFDNWFNGYINQSAVTKKAENVISELTPAGKKILDTLSDSVVQQSKGEKLDSGFVINTINYLINDAKPAEKSAIIDKMAQLPKIDYNKVDENEISILEHILNAEDLQLLNLVNKTTLNYYPALDYTYYQISNENFKKEVDKLDLNFKDLKEAVKSENLKNVTARIDDVNSPFFNYDRHGKELCDIALDVENAAFYEDIIDIFGIDI